MDSLYHLSTSEPKELWVILLSVHKNKKKVISLETYPLFMNLLTNQKALKILSRMH